MLHCTSMSAIRLPLLCAFAGGCLSSAVLFGIWHAGGGEAAPTPQPRDRHAELVVAPKVQEVDVDTASSPAPAEPARVEAVNRGSDTKSDEPAPSVAQDVANAAPTPGSSAVSDILTDLEAAYRQRLIAAARAEAEAAPAPAPVAANVASALAEPPREVAPRTLAPVVPAVAPVSVPVAPAAPPPSAPPPVEPPAIVAQNDRPRDVHFGDVNQNTYNITNVRQGDVYVTQQLAMLQYLQLLGTTPNAGLAQPTHLPRGIVQRPTQQFRQFPSTLTNPDNPWGFNFAPPNLVH